MDGALGLLNHQLVGATHNDAHGLTWIGTTGDLHTQSRNGNVMTQLTGCQHQAPLKPYTLTIFTIKLAHVQYSDQHVSP